ncbi:hypothetical protein [Streptomyces sp. NPDC001401]
MTVNTGALHGCCRALRKDGYCIDHGVDPAAARCRTGGPVGRIREVP